jgi:hypothetical protein
VDFDTVANELFGLAPAAFIERRNAMAARAGSEGDPQLAAKIKALRRPTVGAALVNALVRERREVIDSFVTLSAALRDAQDRSDGQQIRDLAGSRQNLMRVLDRHIADLASERGLTASRTVQQEVHATMLAALSNTQAEATVLGGRMESGLNDGTFAANAPAAAARPKSASHTEPESAGSASTRRIESAQRKLNDANASAAAAVDDVEKLAAAAAGAQRELTDLDNQLDETLRQARRLERERSTADRKVATARDAHAEAVRRAQTLRDAAAKANTAYEFENTNRPHS